MRQRSVNYFVGSLFSLQFLYAYGIAAGFTTAGQLLLIWLNAFSGIPQRMETLSIVIELYIETLIPLWIPPITGRNVFILTLNIVIAVWILLSWTISYDRSL